MARLKDPLSGGKTRPLEREAARRAQASGSASLALHVDARTREPLHVQLARQLRRLILAGRIAPGARLPASRALAVDLGISRATVVLAFDQLASEGYIEGRHGAGMFVAAGLPGVAAQAFERPPPAPPRAATKGERPEPPRPFQLGATDASLFPYRTWARLLYRTWRDPDPSLTGGIDVFGWPELRTAIARHLREWRAIVSEAHQIVVTSGTADATELIARCAFPPGAAVYVEEPGYPLLRHTLAGLGALVRSVPVDEDGFDIARASSLGPAAGAIVTPSRQFPLGATLPLARRLSLLEWADATDAFVLEDDFDSEYRYQGSPLPALMSLDRNGRTIYIGSFSKVLSPTLRLGFVVLPDRLVEAARRHLARRGTLASLVAQPALARFIGDGDYATHIRRTRRIYARRMAALVEAGDSLSGLMTLAPTQAGMHIVADLTPALSRRLSDREASARARANGIVAQPLSDLYAGRPTRSALLLGFAGFPEERLRAAVSRLARSLAG
jgi:GntR family transcriptional regulator/MocR family aminotransferase